MNRRGFLTGIIAACAAPAIIRTPGLIMPIKPIKPIDLTTVGISHLSWVAIHRRMFEHIDPELMLVTEPRNLPAARGQYVKFQYSFSYEVVPQS